MGRNRRKRLNEPLDHQENIINLKKFMSRNGFNNDVNLKLRNFPFTGRGVACATTLHENDVLITVPYSLMISYTTLNKSKFLQVFTSNNKLTIHDLLACFIVFEKHKKDSSWKDYIDSLPPKPPWLPSLLSDEHIELLPVDLRLEVKKSRRLFQQSWSRIRKSIKKEWTCGCCGKEADCVLDPHSFTWGFILVNTRAVYVDPQIVRQLCDIGDILSDEPCMALCPFLDMFNHSHKARSKAGLIYEEGKFVFQLTTLTRYEKHEQVFISYGDHDNARLFLEYGFFIPGNSYDTIPIQAEEVLKVLKPSISDFLFKFISKHAFDKDLFMGEGGASFNLKSLLFVASRDESVKNIASIIFNDDYPEEFSKKTLLDMCLKLLSYKLECLNLDILKVCGLDSVIVNFLDCRRTLIKNLMLINKQ